MNAPTFLINMSLDELADLCEARIHAAVPWHELYQLEFSQSEFVEKILSIVRRNQTSGRVERVMRARPVEGYAEYIDRVIAVYLHERQRVEELAARDEARWRDLYEQLTRRAYVILLRLRPPSDRVLEESVDFAQSTCVKILDKEFPYDVSFDAWATLILKNEILRRFTRSTDAWDRYPHRLSLDQGYQRDAEVDVSPYDRLGGALDIEDFDRIDLREQMLWALDQLSSHAQQQVIIDTFFYELDDEEIALRLGKSKNAVYILRHRALRGLQQIMKSVKEIGWEEH